jgi:hypothetical protein
MFQFLFGVAFGAAGYWAWQSFGREQHEQFRHK